MAIISALWHTLAVSSVLETAVAMPAASSAPLLSTSPLSSLLVAQTSKSFLGGGLSGDGVLSLIFSAAASAAKGKDGNEHWSMANIPFPEGDEAPSDFPGLSGESGLRLNGSIVRNGRGHIEWHVSAPGVVTVTVDTRGAAAPPSQHSHQFLFPNGTLFYGVWAYPWGGSITSNRYGSTESDASGHGQPTLDIGIYGTQPGINWCNARAPFFFSDSGIGVYVDTDMPVAFTFDDGNGDAGASRVTLGVNASVLSYHILYGHSSSKSLLRGFARLSSYPMMPTESGYGPIFWSDDFERGFHDSSIRNAQDNINDVANHLDEYRIRATAFFADRPYGTGNQSFGNFDFDPTFYPDPAVFIASLATRGLDFQVWTANRAFLSTELFNVSASHGWLFPGIDPTKFLGPALNLSIPEAYDYFRDRMTTFVSDTGIRGFKIDRGEEREMPDDEQNRQQPLYLKLCEEVMQAVWNVSGPYYNFARSAFDRDRSHVAIWNGDPLGNFTGLQYSVASGIRAGLLGFSHWGCDTGGYNRKAGSPTEEVFARWMHFSAWTPMYEIMVGLNHTPWYEYSPKLTEVLRQTADMHTRLVPYLRSLAYEASTTGIPALRALFLEFPDDHAVYEVADMYMLGSEFLLAPVLTEGGSRAVRFPLVSDNRHKFLDYNDKSTVFASGDVQHIADLPLQTTPVYIREGAVIPLGDVFAGNAIGWKTSANATSSPWSPHLTIEVYPSYDVPEMKFVYYRGPEGRRAGSSASAQLQPGPVTITLRTNITTRTVEVEASGDYGVHAEVVVYQKTEGKTQKRWAQRGEALGGLTRFVAHGVYSLFE